MVNWDVWRLVTAVLVANEPHFTVSVAYVLWRLSEPAPNPNVAVKQR